MKKLLALLSLLLVALIISGNVFALDLEWDANPDGQGVLGYYLYYQRSDGTSELMQATINGRLTTHITINDSNFPDIGMPYSLYLTAFNADLESGPSNVIEFTPGWPGGSPLTPDQPNGFRLSDTPGVSITDIKPVGQ